jgi:hypothetical protein
MMVGPSVGIINQTTINHTHLKAIDGGLIN